MLPLSHSIPKFIHNTSVRLQKMGQIRYGNTDREKKHVEQVTENGLRNWRNEKKYYFFLCCWNCSTQLTFIRFVIVVLRVLFAFDSFVALFLPWNIANWFGHLPNESNEARKHRLISQTWTHTEKELERNLWCSRFSRAIISPRCHFIFSFY